MPHGSRLFSTRDKDTHRPTLILTDTDTHRNSHRPLYSQTITQETFTCRLLTLSLTGLHSLSTPCTHPDSCPVPVRHLSLAEEIFSPGSVGGGLDAPKQHPHLPRGLSAGGRGQCWPSLLPPVGLQSEQREEE